MDNNAHFKIRWSIIEVSLFCITVTLWRGWNTAGCSSSSGSLVCLQP